MRRWIKVAVWIGVFAVCAGAGAYVAAHTNPFPPGVEDPGARPTPTSTAPSSVPRWTGTMRSRTEHVFHVGGSCVTVWRTTLSFRVRETVVRGTGTARLVGDVLCDFPEVQVQTRTLRLLVRGDVVNGIATLRFSLVGQPDPIGSRDLGGFTSTIALAHPRADLGSTTTTASASSQRSDGDLGVYRSSSRVTLACVRGC